MRAVAGQQTFSAYPLVTLAAALTCGVLLGRAFAPAPAPFAAVGILITVAAFISWKRGRLKAAALLLVLGFVCAGAALASAEAKSEGGGARLRGLYERGEVDSGDPVELTGVLERAPEPAPDGWALALRAESLSHKGRLSGCAGRVELFMPSGDAGSGGEFEALELRRGARVRVLVALKRAEKFRNPGVGTLGEYLERQDAEAVGTIKSPLLVERLDDERVFLPLVWLDAWRLELTRRMDALFPVETAGVLKASLLGNRRGLSRATAERFREGGTFHVLVISGLHITFIGGVVWALMRAFTRRALWRWAASAAVVWGYALLVGAESSVVRAALMFTAAALAPALGRRSAPLNALGGAALCLLVWRPRNLFDPSFQLTFLSVLAIVCLAWPLVSNLKAVGEWRPTRATPYPPACAPWLRTLGEVLFWRGRAWAREMARAAHAYQLYKSPWAARLERWRVQWLMRYGFGALVVSAAVSLVLLPLSAVYFHRLPLASLVLNLFVGALMALTAGAAVCALAAASLSAQAAEPFVRLADVSAKLMTHSVDPFAAAGLAGPRLPEYTGVASAVYFLYFVPVLLLMWAVTSWNPLDGGGYASGRGREDVHPARGGGVEVDEGDADKKIRGRRRVVVKVASASLLILLFVIVLHPLSAGGAGGRLRIDFLDVGQGDAALVTAPDGTTLLVDGGGRPRFGPEGVEGTFERDARGIGERVVSEYLWWRGLDRVDYVLATHADADHAEGLSDVLRNFQVSAAFAARAPSDDPQFARLAASAREARVPLYLVGRGDVLRFGGVSVEVLWPPPEGVGASTKESRNDDSLVLLVRHGRRAFLLTGDVEARAEASLVAAGDPLRCDALKVAHHGSRTSSTPAFVAAARPSLAVISVGLDSPYGHPHPSVLERLRAHGAQVLTTGGRGTITLSTDGDDLQVKMFISTVER